MPMFIVFASSLVFVAFCVLLGTRLVRALRREGRSPELFVGLSFLATSVGITGQLIALTPAELARFARGDGAREAPSDDVLWRVLFSLQRRKYNDASLYAGHATARAALVRLFAVKGLAVSSATPERDAALARALADDDWRVALEAARGLAGRIVYVSAD